MSKRDLLDLPFVTNEQKFEYWQRSKQEHKDALEYIAKLEKIIKNVLSGEYPRDRVKQCNHEKYSWEDCEQCIDDYLHVQLEVALASKPASLKE